MINTLLDFAKKAGIYLKQQKENIKPLLNKDTTIESLVTKADLSVSNLFEQTIKKHFSHLNYIIIDEEKISKETNIFEKINSSEFQFVIDPIDGTIQYAHGHPLYGISIGVFKNTKPLLGIIYLPELGELTYFDGSKAFWVQHAFTKKAIKKELIPGTKSSLSVIFGHSWLWNLSNDFSISEALFLDYYSSVSQCFYTLIGKATAYCMKLNLWDIAGTIPIADYLGMNIQEYGNNKIYNKISAEFFNPNMSVKKPCILCYPEDYDKVSSLISPKKAKK